MNNSVAEIVSQTEKLNSKEREVLIWSLLQQEIKNSSFHFQQIRIADKPIFLVEFPYDFESENPTSVKRNKPEFGCMSGIVKYMATDFNDPIDDFKDYM